jgi:hypothetical protein
MPTHAHVRGRTVIPCDRYIDNVLPYVIELAIFSPGLFALKRKREIKMMKCELGRICQEK